MTGAPAHLPPAGSRVTLCEVLLRDGIQGWPHWIETVDKQRLARAIVAAGIGEIDATSFVSPKLVPQLVDGLDLLAAIAGEVRVRVLTVNMKGIDSVVAAHRTVRRIERCGIPYSVSEPHNLANLRRGHAEHRIVVAEMVQKLLEEGIEPLLGVATAFGCPIRGDVAPEEALAVADWAYGLGVRAIMFGDTTGMANPRAVVELYSRASSSFTDADLIAHFHDNLGAGIINAITAVGAGATTVDSCLGGLGGEPAAVEQGISGNQGNVVTEDLFAILQAMGVETGIDGDSLLDAGRLAEEVVGRPLFSKAQRASRRLAETTRQ